MTTAPNALLRTQVSPLPPGDRGVSITIRAMRKLIDQGKSNATIRAKALEILNQYRVAAFDWAGQARAIYDWFLRNITFTPDPVGKEGVQGAEFTLAYRRGDCDCQSVLMCSLLETVGMKCRLITIAGDPRDPSQFSHVYPQVSVDGRWVTVDAARRKPAFGTQPKNYSRKRAWALETGEWADMQGININPAARRGAYRATRSPIFRNGNPLLSGVPRRFMRRGRGNYRTLGDIDWDAITGAITAGTTGAANIITAERAAPQNLFPTTGPNARTPYGYSLAPFAATPYPSASMFGGVSAGTLMLLGLGGIALLALRR